MFVTHPSWMNQSPLMEHFVEEFSGVTVHL